MDNIALKKIPTLKDRYNREDDEFVDTFFTPCLSVACCYKRAVGFFSSSSLITLSTGVHNLLANNGKMLLVTSPVLSKKDILAIENGLAERDEVISKPMLPVQ